MAVARAKGVVRARWRWRIIWGKLMRRVVEEESSGTRQDEAIVVRE